MQIRRGFAAGWGLAVMACVAAAMPLQSQAAGSAPDRDPVRILSYEPFRPLTASTPAVSRKTSTGTLTRLQFDAYGRRFDLSLERNTRLTQALDLSNPEGPALSLYQGTIQRVAGSWVRLSAQGQDIRGMIWDGRELYIVELAQTLEAAGTALQKTSHANSIIFRLADTEIDPDAAFCEVDEVAPRDGKSAYSQLLNELKGSPIIMQAANAAVRLELSALGDSLFRRRYATDQRARDEILVRLNNVDGIFSSQLGIEIQVPTLQIKHSGNDPLSATTSPQALLDELGELRRRSPELRARGLTHLFTGRTLDGTGGTHPVGIAYTDALCSDRYGAGLTQSNGRGAWIESLTAAHEIGHNFGAIHDGEGQCASTPQNQYIMSPAVSPIAQEFSECSLVAMRPRLQSARCIIPLTPPDVTVPADLGTLHKAVTRPFEWELTVNNVGGSSATGVRVTILVPPVVLVDEAWVAGRSCTAGAGVISCDLGDIAGSGSRVVHLVLRSDSVGSSSIFARVTANNDSLLANNSGDGTLIIDPEADLAVSLQAPASIQAGSTTTASFTITNLAVIDADAVDVEFTLSGGITATSAEIAAGGCSVQAMSVRCSLPAVAARSGSSGNLTLAAATAGMATLRASVSGRYVDPNQTNDSTTQSIDVTATSANQNAGGSRGGGGSSSAGFVVALALLLATRRLARGVRPSHAGND